MAIQFDLTCLDSTRLGAAGHMVLLWLMHARTFSCGLCLYGSRDGQGVGDDTERRLHYAGLSA